jgi:hypothetical protein
MEPSKYSELQDAIPRGPSGPQKAEVSLKIQIHETGCRIETLHFNSAQRSNAEMATIEDVGVNRDIDPPGATNVWFFGPDHPGSSGRYLRDEPKRSHTILHKRRCITLNANNVWIPWRTVNLSNRGRHGHGE